MTFRPSRILTAVPQTWPVQLEIMKAIRVLAAQVKEEKQLQRRAELAAIRQDGELLAEIIREFHQELCKAGFNPDEPRVPAGNPDGGQWTREGGDGSSSESAVVSDATADNSWIPGARYAANDPPGIGHNQGPPLEDPPKIPPKAPAKPKLVNDFLKAAAYWLAVGISTDRRIVRFRAALLAVQWLAGKYLPSIISYLDAPKTWEELQQNALRPRPGYDIHHPVEQTPARDDGFPESMVDGPAN